MPAITTNRRGSSVCVRHGIRHTKTEQSIYGRTNWNLAHWHRSISSPPILRVLPVQARNLESPSHYFTKRKPGFPICSVRSRHVLRVVCGAIQYESKSL